MNMVDLVLSVCLLSNPSACEDKHLYFEWHGSLNACMFQAQPYIAAYMSEHPQYKLVRWRCEVPDTSRRGA